MKVKNVPNRWIYEDGLRLDCGPYMSGAMEARKILEELSLPKNKLCELTAGHDGGIYNGPKFRRNYVKSKEYGVPFLGSSSILAADLSNLPLLRKKDAYSRKLAHLEVKEGTTLITCSGTIGRMAYARSDMEGMWSSQDVLKVVPDRSKILPGYLYAYLSSKFGVPMITSGTYGAIIQHIEPHHIAGLPVPRLAKAVEQEIDDLISKAANKRCMATKLLEKAQDLLNTELNLPQEHNSYKVWASRSSLEISSRLDAFYFHEQNNYARTALDNTDFPLVSLSSVADVFIPNIFKRQYADNPLFGYPYITGADVFQLAPTSERFLMKRVSEENGLLLEDGMILTHEAGQLSGLIGHSVQVGSYLDGFACTNNMIRTKPKKAVDCGYLFSLLSSTFGVRLIQRESAGSSIPHIEAGRIQDLQIPWPDQSIREKIGKPAVEAQSLRDESCKLDIQARELVEAAIREAV